MKPSEKSLAALGILSPWLLYGPQQDVYLHQQSHRFPFCEMNRRFGKTFTTFIRLHETLLRIPGFVARWCEPWKNQCREILQPEIQKICQMIPAAHRPVWRQTHSFYEYASGSRLYLRGVNEDKGESARGAFSNLIVLDEIGSYKDTDYIVNEVLLPQLLTTKGQMVMIGTPPRKLDHEYYKYKQQAIADGAFIQKTIEDCTWFEPSEIEAMCQAVGGVESAAWQREFLCKPVADEESKVIPEFDEVKHVKDPLALPAYYDIYVAMDAGFHDHTAVLIAVCDFLRHKVQIIDEVWVRGKNSAEIAELIKKTIELHFPKKTPYRYIADAQSQILYDLNTLHGLPFVMPLKDDKFAAINNVRIMMGKGEIEIHRRCHNLAFQLRVGMWNDKKKDFLRGDLIGHLDAIAALVYLCRSVDWFKNPYPLVAEDVSQKDHWINEIPNPAGALAKQLFPFSKGGFKK